MSSSLNTFIHIKLDTSQIGDKLSKPMFQDQCKGTQAMVVSKTQGYVWKTLLEISNEQYHVWRIAWSRKKPLKWSSGKQRELNDMLE